MAAGLFRLLCFVCCHLFVGTGDVNAVHCVSFSPLLSLLWLLLVTTGPTLELTTATVAVAQDSVSVRSENDDDHLQVMMMTTMMKCDRSFRQSLSARVRVECVML